jgi:hypothetical protein
MSLTEMWDYPTAGIDVGRYVWVETAATGGRRCSVEAVLRDRADFVAIPGAPDPASVLEVVQEWGVDLICLIAWTAGGESTCCAILHSRDGWRDLRGQRLGVMLMAG